MTIITNTFTRHDAIGVREDLADVIYNISPTETPFQTNAGRGKAAQTLHEWQNDALATASSSNQQIEGDDIASYDAVTATVRLGNYTEIARKTVVISDTQEVVDKAGRKSEIASLTPNLPRFSITLFCTSGSRSSDFSSGYARLPISLETP